MSVREQALKNQLDAARERLGCNACTTLLIVDAQSVKNTDTAALKGYDAGKKVLGTKRHIAVDTQGFPHAVALTTAEVTDRSGALQVLQRCKSGLTRVQILLTDAGYVGQPFVGGTRHSGDARHGTGGQAQRTTHFLGHAPATGLSRAILLGW